MEMQICTDRRNPFRGGIFFGDRGDPICKIHQTRFIRRGAFYSALVLQRRFDLRGFRQFPPLRRIDRARSRIAPILASTLFRLKCDEEWRGREKKKIRSAGFYE